MMECPLCQSTDIYDQDCPACNGSSECPDCMGEGDPDCPECEGQGVCNECQGDGFMHDEYECAECGENGDSYHFDKDKG